MSSCTVRYRFGLSMSITTCFKHQLKKLKHSSKPSETVKIRILQFYFRETKTLLKEVALLLELCVLHDVTFIMHIPTQHLLQHATHST